MTTEDTKIWVDWYKDYEANLPRQRVVISQVMGKWRDRGLSALWRGLSGDKSGIEESDFCDFVVERLGLFWSHLYKGVDS